MHKKFWIGFLVVFVAFFAMDWLVNGVLLKDEFAATAQLWRPVEDMKMGVFCVVDLFVAFFFTLIFSKGYEGKGLPEGLRYGFFVGMLMAVPMAYGMYGAMPIPYSLALKWFLFGLTEYVILGAVVAAIFGKEPSVTRVQKA
jgi:hypothetical protein